MSTHNGLHAVRLISFVPKTFGDIGVLSVSLLVLVSLELRNDLRSALISPAFMADSVTSDIIGASGLSP